jgi:hypothetical protein
MNENKEKCDRKDIKHFIQKLESLEKQMNNLSIDHSKIKESYSFNKLEFNLS